MKRAALRKQGGLFNSGGSDSVVAVPKGKIRMVLLASLLLIAATQPIPDRPKGETFATLNERDDPELKAARAKARATIGEWLDVLAKQSPDVAGIQFQFPLGGNENIWVENAERKGDTLVGTLAIQPLQKGWKRGDKVEVPLKDVSDWSYWTRDNVAHGYHTYPVLFSRMPRDRANQLRRQLGWPEQ
jgi:uncharacterized protein YegJ (DUF2314 family)